MKISIALATYNGVNYIYEQLTSFKNQVRLADEIIVCDDLSDDDTIKIIEEFSNSNPHLNIKIFINQQRLGHELNFGEAISQCTGDIIFLSDQDDVWLKDKLLVHEKIYESSPHVHLIINDIEITDHKLCTFGITAIEQFKASKILGVNKENYIHGCATSFRSILKQIILPVPSLDYGHDLWIHNIAYLLNCRLVIKDVLQYYRRHGNNSFNWAFKINKKSNWKELISVSKNIDINHSYKKRLQALELILMRLQLSLFSSDLAININISDVIKEIMKAQVAIKNRIELNNSNSLKSRLIAIKMLVLGDYKYFLGWKSFLKDMLGNFYK